MKRLLFMQRSSRQNPSEERWRGPNAEEHPGTHAGWGRFLSFRLYLNAPWSKATAYFPDCKLNIHKIKVAFPNP